MATRQLRLIDMTVMRDVLRDGVAHYKRTSAACDAAETLATWGYLIRISASHREKNHRGFKLGYNGKDFSIPDNFRGLW